MLSPPLSPLLIWLVGGQFLLYAAGWLLCSLLLHRERAAVVPWALFMLLVGVGYLLMADRGEPRSPWAFGGADLCFVGGFLMLWQGLDRFFGLPGRDAERLVIWLALAGALGWLGAGKGEPARWRVMLTYGALAWVLWRLLCNEIRQALAEFGPHVVLALRSLALLMMLAMLLRVGQQAVNPEPLFEAHLGDGTHLRQMLAFLVVAALFNFGFIALVVARLLGQLREQSRRDPLTGLLNRRALDDELQREWQRWQRGGQRFAVLALDLDHFKAVNDRLGHPAGDAVLVQVAGRIAAVARAHDLVARVGGEEFVLLMPQSACAGAAAAADRLRADLAARALATAGGPGVTVTISIGVAAVKSSDDSVRQVLQRADAALYAAKAGGRNRVVCLDGTD